MLEIDIQLIIPEFSQQLRNLNGRPSPLAVINRNKCISRFLKWHQRPRKFRISRMLIYFYRNSLLVGDELGNWTSTFLIPIPFFWWDMTNLIDLTCLHIGRWEWRKSRCPWQFPQLMLKSCWDKKCIWTFGQGSRVKNQNGQFACKTSDPI